MFSANVDHPHQKMMSSENVVPCTELFSIQMLTFPPKKIMFSLNVDALSLNYAQCKCTHPTTTKLCSV